MSSGGAADASSDASSVLDAKNITFEELKISEPPIGTGAFGVVYQGVLRGTTVAVKKLVHWKEDALKEFLHEVKLMRSLSHPNLVLFMGACTNPPDLLIVSEFLFGGDLNQLISKKEITLDWSHRMRLAQEIARGMTYLHASGVVHRDFKSNNILLDENGRAKVADFGLSKVVKNRSQLTQSQTGNWAYMAPEMMRSVPYAHAVDVYGYGVVLCELILRLDAGDDDMPRNSKTFAIDSGAVVSQAPPDAPAQLLSLARDCASLFPPRRPSFMEALARLRNSLDVRCFGSNASNQSGQSSAAALNVSVPTSLEDLSLKNIVRVQASQSASYALTASGEVLCWGRPFFEQQRAQQPFSIARVFEAVRARDVLTGPKEKNSTLVLLTDADKPFVLRDTRTSSGSPLLEPIAQLTKRIVAMDCGLTHSAAINEDGVLFTWGSKAEYSGHDAVIDQPKVLEALKGTNCIAVSCGPRHSLLLTDSYHLYVWGDNESGQLGAGDKVAVRVPKRLEFPDGETPVQIACGSAHSAVVTHSGRVYLFGSNSNGQIGLPSSATEALVPVHLSALAGQSAVQVACGSHFTVILVERGGGVCEERSVAVFGNDWAPRLPPDVHRIGTGFSLPGLAQSTVHRLACGDGHLVLLCDSLASIINSDRHLARGTGSGTNLRGDIASLIEDGGARAFWDANVGPMQLKCLWDQFAAKIAKVVLGPAEQISFLKELVCETTIDKGAQVTQEKFGRLFKWFPDFTGGGLEAAVTVASQEWFHGLMDKNATDKTLTGRAVGTYLVRLSTTTPGDFVLAVVSADRRIVQLPILKQPKQSHTILRDLREKIQSLTLEKKILTPLPRQVSQAEDAYAGYREVLSHKLV